MENVDDMDTFVYTKAIRAIADPRFPVDAPEIMRGIAMHLHLIVKREMADGQTEMEIYERHKAKLETFADICDEFLQEIK
jgi:hypothetical protein